MMVTMSAIQKACELVGGQSKLAVALGITPQAVHQLVVKGHVPAERVLEIERATGGRVTRHELRPDLYPEETQSRRSTDPHPEVTG